MFSSDDDSRYTRRTLIGVGVASLFIGVASASVIDTEVFPTVKVSYGEARHDSSDVVVNSYEISGPGINVDAIEVGLENTHNELISIDIDVYLMDGDNVVSEGSESESIDGDSTETVIVDVNRVQENDFDEIDIRVTET